MGDARQPKSRRFMERTLLRRAEVSTATAGRGESGWQPQPSKVGLVDQFGRNRAASSLSESQGERG